MSFWGQLFSLAAYFHVSVRFGERDSLQPLGSQAVGTLPFRMARYLILTLRVVTPYEGS